MHQLTSASTFPARRNILSWTAGSWTRMNWCIVLGQRIVRTLARITMCLFRFPQPCSPAASCWPPKTAPCAWSRTASWGNGPDCPARLCARRGPISSGPWPDAGPRTPYFPPVPWIRKHYPGAGHLRNRSITICCWSTTRGATFRPLSRTWSAC